jgi:hypothetical protein
MKVAGRLKDDFEEVVRGHQKSERQKSAALIPAD